ncbi:MAG: O-Antigen ligase [Bacteroidetes bacterium ADurb.Bin408]|nr:MAG: O-Antigen ligase [Bacteroidetes bacterium ADurb.Bin408]
MSLIAPKSHRVFFIIGLSLLAAALPFSLFALSVAQFVLIINWFCEGNVLERFKAFFRNKPALIFSLFFVLHIIGLVYTTDFNYAFKDIRTKLPLLLLPLVLSTTAPLKRRELNLIFSVFIAAVGVATVISTFYYMNHQVKDIREVSRFISHIRFSLMICMAVVLLAWYLGKQKGWSFWIYILCAALLLWFLVFLTLFESVTGVAVLGVLLIFFTIKSLFKPVALYYKIAAVVLIVGFFIFSYLYVQQAAKEYFHKNMVDFSTLEKYTAEGNPYLHDSTSLQSENGNLIWIYICKEELEREWKKRSAYDFNGFDDKNQLVQYTLIRYMASKGLRKDALALQSLRDDEIKAIEKGIPSVRFFEKMTLKKRIHEILWEYENYKKDGNANGLSVMLRVEFAKTALGIIERHPVFGVGTGDVNMAFKEQYERRQSVLRPEYRWRSHNQYLSVCVAFGLAGFVVFILSLFYPPLKTHAFSDGRYLAFFIIILVSMLTEDTLETQAGVSFYAFFSALFLFGVSKDNN